MSTTHISLEPPAITAQDGLDDDLFAKPARLYEVTNEGKQVFTRQVGEDPNKAPTARLLRIWQERGDFSQLTSRSIGDEQHKDKDVATTTTTNDLIRDQDGDEDDVHGLGMTPEQMRELQVTMMQQLELARGELTTALDLLSIIAAPTVATTVDAEALPLPQQTLTIVPSAPPVPLPSSDDDSTNAASLLPLATSLSSLRESANSFFSASNQVLAFISTSTSTSTSTASTSTWTSSSSRNSTSTQWSTLLHLHSSTPFPLIPLGAQPNASFSGQGEHRLAKQVGVFFGCAEAAPAFRRVGVAQVEQVLQEVQERKDGKGKGKGKGKSRGRKLVVEVEMEGKGKDWCVWSGGDKDGKELDVEEVLRQRGRNVFAEELFTVLSNEARSDASVKSRLELGKRSQGDSVVTEGHGWKLKVTMVAVPNPNFEAPTPEPNAIAPLLVPLLRLLLIQEYTRRRSSTSSSASIPVLATLSAFLSHLYRLISLSQDLTALTSTIDPSIPTSTTYHPPLASAPLQAIRKILTPPTAATEIKELGGRIVLRIGSHPTSLFHISHSTLLPQPFSISTNTSSASPSMGVSAFALASHHGLVLQAPRSAPVVVGSVGQLQGFLKEQMGEVLRRYMGRKIQVELERQKNEGIEVDQGS
ncbi:BQ2448_4161 [Microbotryum intermedium]|uniref:Mediator of RNA polymerase II transcription subunit 17 n=1 Tax=Microbotryum intermedium TaxID=269621 RepID=A0A238FL74_9BASI|nr:BQ2448_4161 [Microbotryum intermedium]